MDKKDFIEWVRKLEPGYSPNSNVRSQLANVDLIAIVGPTGVGKTTIIEKLGVPVVKSDVSRQPRSNEKKDQQYNFRDDYLNILKEVKSGDYAQFVVSNSDEFYGTHSSSYPQDGSCTMAIFASAIPKFRSLGFKKVIPIYIMPPGYVEWMRRVGAQRDSDLSQRLAEAISSIKIALADDEYKFVLNDNVDLAIEDVKKIMSGESIDEHRNRLARETGDVLLERLGDQDDDSYFSEIVE